MLIPIPPYVLACEDPPGTSGSLRGFRQRAYRVAPPVEFPRELFADALVEHARLLDAHGAEILAAPLDHPGQSADERFVKPEDIDAYPALLVGQGDKHAVHRWRTVDLSYVVERCRGILLRLMETPREGFGHVVVVAAGVASLHLVRSVRPRRVGESPRLEVVERDLVVEPWLQTHAREGDSVVTRWRTPAGDVAMSRVHVPPRPKGAHQVAGALLKLYDASLREHLAEHARQHPAEAPVAVLDSWERGETIRIQDRREPDYVLESFPEILAPMRVARAGLTPVVVASHGWLALCWLATSATSDVAVPEPIVFGLEPGDDGDDDAEEEAEARARIEGTRRARHEAEEHRAYFLRAFPPREPWAPRASDVHEAWRMGLLFAVTVVGVGLVVAVMAICPAGRFRPWVFAVAAVLSVVWLYSGGSLFIGALRDLDPVRRKRHWTRWKQLDDELQGAWRAAAAPKVVEVPHRTLWMRKLAERLGRLERLAAWNAPDIILANVRKLVRDAIAELDKSDADAVLAAWPNAVRYLEPREKRVARKSTQGGDKPN